MKIHFLQKAVAATLCVLACASVGAGGNNDKNSVEVDADEKAQAAHGKSKKLSLSRIEGRHIDGVKGYRVYPSAEGPTLKQPEQLSMVVADLACKAAVLGLVELEGAKSFAGKDDIGVFTKYRFRILDDWRAAPADRGRIVHLIMDGGEVVHAGERYRFENPHANYKIGSRYILIAGTPNVNISQNTIYSSPPFLEVSDDLVHPAPGWTPFALGSTVAQAKASVDEALAKWGGCK